MNDSASTVHPADITFPPTNQIDLTWLLAETPQD